jgi:hypothetical protein
VRRCIELPRQTFIDTATGEAAEVAEPLEAADDVEAADGDGAVANRRNRQVRLVFFRRQGRGV